jgi:hypothetical protein
MKRRIEISQETNQMIVLRRRGKAAEAWCDRCAEQVRMVTAEQGVLISGKSLRQLVNESDAGELHYQETPEGLLSICLNSLNHHGASEREQIQIIENLTKG